MALTPLVVSSVTSPGVSVIFEKVGTDYYPISDIMWGPAGSPALVATNNPLPIQLRSSGGTEMGTSVAPFIVAPASAGIVFSAAQSGTWTVTQGGTWLVNAAQSGSFVVTVAQMPAVSLAANASVVATQGGTWSVNQGGTWNVNAVQSGSWVVTVGQMPAVSLAANASVAASQVGTWTVNQGGSWSVAQSGAWVVSVGQIVAVSLAANTSVLAQQGGSPWGVSIAGGAVSVNGAVSILTGTNTIGNVGFAPRSAGGCSIFRVITSASTNAAVVKGAAGQVYGYAVYNNTANPRYMKLYNKATVPLPASDVPAMTIIVPGASAGSGANVDFTNGISFGTGIGIIVTTSIADTDNSVTAQNDVVVNLLYV